MVVPLFERCYTMFRSALGTWIPSAVPREFRTDLRPTWLDEKDITVTFITTCQINGLSNSFFRRAAGRA